MHHAFAPDAFVAYCARFLARGGYFSEVEGLAFDRHVVIDYPDMAAARACYI